MASVFVCTCRARGSNSANKKDGGTIGYFSEVASSAPFAAIDRNHGY